MHTPNRYSKRDRHWLAVLKIISAFSARHLQQAMLLSHNLGMQYASDGLPQHVLTRAWDIPLLDQHFWLLNDWAVEESPRRDAFEKNLFVASTFTFLALKTQASRLDPHSFFDAAYRGLEDELFRQAKIHWKQILTDASPFWAHFQSAHDTAFPAAVPIDPLAANGHWAFAGLPAIATALWADKAPLIQPLIRFNEECRVVLQIIDNLATVYRDLQNGRVTYPIQRALNAMGVTDTTGTSIEMALGALLINGTLTKILQENTARIAAARSIAIELGLPTLQAHCDELDKLMLQVRGLFSPKQDNAPVEQEPSILAFFAPAPDVLQNVLLKAESYLLADLTFREAWDVQQHSYPSAPLIIGSTFPASLVAEILCQQGHEMPAVVDGVLATLQSNAFRYWDHPHLLDPDADDLALALRLIPHSSNPDAQRVAFETPLRWMREHQLPSGQIPVWFRKHDSPQRLRNIAVLYGSNCTSVETNLLLGLIKLDWNGYRDVIEACARSWCRRWLELGLGASEHYTPLYSLWAGAELIAQLLASPVDETLKSQLQKVATLLNERLTIEAARDDLSPQDAAFLMLASLRTEALQFDRGWVTALFKHQRQDGCWEGEPIYITPAARNLTTTWFKSRTITTAFCYHALKHYHASLLAK